MTKYGIWKDLVKRTRQARKERDEKFKYLITCEWNNPEKSCIKVIQIKSLGVPTDGNDQFNFLNQNCDEFSERITCTNFNCPLREKQADYVLANLKFRAIRADRNRAFQKMFIRSK